MKKTKDLSLRAQKLPLSISDLNKIAEEVTDKTIKDPDGKIRSWTNNSFGPYPIQAILSIHVDQRFASISRDLNGEIFGWDTRQPIKKEIAQKLMNARTVLNPETYFSQIYRDLYGKKKE